MDFDGEYEYSRTISIKIDPSNNRAIEVYPNPIQKELNIINGEGQAIIYNVMGQEVKAFSIFNPQFSIDTDDLLKGQYILHITQKNGNIVTMFFVK